MEFPVETFRVGSKIRANIWVHFVHCHVRDTIVILEEGILPHRRCPECDMFIPSTELNFQHSTTDLYAQGSERNLRRLAH